MKGIPAFVILVNIGKLTFLQLYQFTPHHCGTIIVGAWAAMVQKACQEVGWMASACWIWGLCLLCIWEDLRWALSRLARWDHRFRNRKWKGACFWSWQLWCLPCWEGTREKWLQLRSPNNSQENWLRGQISLEFRTCLHYCYINDSHRLDKINRPNRRYEWSLSACYIADPVLGTHRQG